MFGILVPLTGTAADEDTVPYVLETARMLDARVHLVRVLGNSDSGHPTDPVDWHVRRLEAELALTHVATRLREGGLMVEEVLLEGNPVEHLITYAQRSDAQLTVLVGGPRRGSPGAPGDELLFRSYVTTLLLPPGTGPTQARGTRSAAASDAAGPPGGDAGQAASSEPQPVRYRRILAALDGSRRAECVFSWVRQLAKRHEADVILAHVVVEPELPRLTPASEEDLALSRRLVQRNREEAGAYLSGARSRLGIPAETRLLQARQAAAALHDLVAREGVDLVIMCAHGYGGESRWPFGSVATSFIDHGSTPLLLVQDMPAKTVHPTNAAAETRTV